MKKILIYSGLLLLLTSTQVTAVVAQTVTEKIKVKGSISPNSENEDKEADPPFMGKLVIERPQRKMGADAAKNVSDIENGLEIVKEIVDKMFATEYNFTLLGQHKYMLNSCLGFKVSAGQFNVKFENPVFEVGNLGKITIKLKVNRINLSVVKVRMKPCTKFEHIPDPCHFGKKIEIGGEATDISLKIVFAPVARALDGSAGVCFFALEDNVLFTWKIGGMNLKPMQNDLDYLGKEMLEDGLNMGLFNVFYSQFISISKEVIPKYFSECENAYSIKEKVKNVQNAMTDDVNDGSNTKDETEKWVITPANIKGVLGRLNINFPKDVERNILLYKQSDRSYLTSVSRNDATFPYAPGIYRIEFSSVPVDNVPIQKGHETRIRAGILDIVSEGSWHLYDETKEAAHTSGNKPKKLMLPIGSYQLKLGGQFYPLKIKEGETVEY